MVNVECIDAVETSAYTIPTDGLESDGTLEWDSTTIVVVQIGAGGQRGLGYSYTHVAAADFIRQKLTPIVFGQDPMAVTGLYETMLRSVRNYGRPGLCASSIAAVDVALWDLKARLLGVPLVTLLGAVHPRVQVYGSGGFTSYSVDRLQEQLAHWVDDGIQRVKMKVGRDPAADMHRVATARDAIGPEAELFVDANGAYTRKEGLLMAEAFARYGVSWFEEPVSSDDLQGLHLVRNGSPSGMDVTAGEYGYDPFYFRAMLEAEAVDILQADATRCLGYTGFLKASALCEAHCIPLSAHTAPALHLPVCCAAAPVVHIEFFYDHVRIERMLFDGVPLLEHGSLVPDLTTPGHGLELKHADAQRYAA